MGLKPAAVALALLTLTGCVQVARSPAPGLSDAARTTYGEQNLDRFWNQSGLEDRRPADIEVAFVDAQAWGDAVVDCITSAGYPGYTSVGGGISYSGDQSLPDERYTMLVCLSRWQVDPEQAGVLNNAQLNYVYDYFRDVTVPCMALAGLPVTEAQTRAQFIETGGYWRPYAAGDDLSSFDLGQSPWYRSVPNNDLAALCPTWPPGLSDPRQQG